MLKIRKIIGLNLPKIAKIPGINVPTFGQKFWQLGPPKIKSFKVCCNNVYSSQSISRQENVFIKVTLHILLCFSNG